MAKQQNHAKRFTWSLPRPADIVYHCLLLSLLSGSAALPFYVHSRQDEFGPPTMEFYGRQELLENFEPEPFVYRRKVVAILKPQLELDSLRTGSIIPATNPDTNRAAAAVSNQPFPDETPVKAAPFEVLFVGAGHALVLDGGRVLTLREGSSLSDGSRIKTIEKAEGGWRVITSAGHTITWSKRS